MGCPVTEKVAKWIEIWVAIRQYFTCRKNVANIMINSA